MEEFCLSLCTPFPSLSLQLLRIKGERMAFVFKLDLIGDGVLELPSCVFVFACV